MSLVCPFGHLNGVVFYFLERNRHLAVNSYEISWRDTSTFRENCGKSVVGTLKINLALLIAGVAKLF